MVKLNNLRVTVYSLVKSQGVHFVLPAQPWPVWRNCQSCGGTTSGKQALSPISANAASRSVQKALTVSTTDAVPSEQLATTPWTTSWGDNWASSCTCSQRTSFSPEGRQKASRWIDADPMAGWQMYDLSPCDVTVTDTLAVSYLPATSSAAGAAAEGAADRKKLKYKSIGHPHFHFAGFRNARTINSKGTDFKWIWSTYLGLH